MTEIIENELYLGGESDITPEFLESRHIKTIINVAMECSNPLPPNSDIQYCKYSFIDSVMDFYEYFEPIIKLINDRIRVGPVIIHCKMGVSRSATFVLAYLIKTYEETLATSYATILRYRPIMPHPEFMRALMKYEKEQLGTQSFNNFIDAYSAKYIVVLCGLPIHCEEFVKQTYNDCDKNYYETEEFFMDLKSVTDSLAKQVNFTKIR